MQTIKIFVTIMPGLRETLIDFKESEMFGSRRYFRDNFIQ